MKTRRIIAEELLNKYQKAALFDHLPTLEEWLLHWLDTYIKPDCKPNTYGNFNSYIQAHILPMLGDYALDEVHSIELQYYIDEKLRNGRIDGKGGLSIKTVKEHISLLNNAFKKAIKLQIIQFNPTQFVEFPKTKDEEIHVFEVAQQEKMVELISHDYQENSGITVLLGMFAGLRIGEISALRIEDIDFEARSICIDESLNRIPQYDLNGKKHYKLAYGTTKSSHIRYVPMNKDIFDALSAYFAKMPNEHKENKKAPLFFNKRQKAMEPRLITYHFRKLMKELQLDKYHFHCLRHTFATRALEGQMDIKSCSKILGHATTQITLDRYTHISTEHLYKEMQKMNHKSVLQ